MKYDWELDPATFHQDRRPRTGSGPCYSHNHRPDGRGGGVCACGDTVDASEL